MLILVTNDDGIHAPGLEALVEVARGFGEVWVVAPDRQQSAVGHAMSLHRPLRVTEVVERTFVVDGTPTDAVFLAVHQIMPGKPTLVLSGINRGANLGPDVTYSGTVGGAIEGAIQGARSAAFSLVTEIGALVDRDSYRTYQPVAARILERMVDGAMPGGMVLNVNFPAVPSSVPPPVRVVRLGNHRYDGSVHERRDPRGGVYYWIGGGTPEADPIPDTDCVVVQEGEVTITPLLVDITNDSGLSVLRDWRL